MRLRKKWWARPEMEESPFVITNDAKALKGKWKEEFNNENPICLELGCGRGKFITENALLNHDINYIGIDLKDEVLIYGKKKIEELKLNNVRLVPLNIMFVGELFDKDEIDKIYINFCNPWPKLRHNKRRLTHTGFLNQYKNFIKKGSQIWFKTDDKGLFDDSLEYFKEAGFTLDFVTYDLHESGFENNIMTEYETKFTGLGMKIMFLIGTYK